MTDASAGGSGEARVLSLEVGVFWDDLDVGTRFVTRRRTVTESDLVGFVNLTWLTEELFANADADDRARMGIPGRVVLRQDDPGPENIYGINLDHHLIPDPVGRAIACLMERIEMLEGRLRDRGEVVESQCATCAADDLCGTEVAKKMKKGG